MDGIVSNRIKRVIKDSTGEELGRINDNSDSQAVARGIASSIYGDENFKLIMNMS